MALNGRGQSAGPRRRLHSSGARLSRVEQCREAPLGGDGDLARRASQHGRAERLFRRCVLTQKRHDLRPEPAAGLHHEGGELHVRALLGRVPLPLVLLALARGFASGTSRAKRARLVKRARVGLRHVDVAEHPLVVIETGVKPG